MKRRYQKPVMLMEDFLLDTSIASSAVCTDYNAEAYNAFLMDWNSNDWNVGVNPTDDDFNKWLVESGYSTDDKNSKFCYFTYSTTNFSS